MKTYYIFRRSDNRRIGKVYAQSKKEAEEKKKRKYGNSAVILSGKDFIDYWDHTKEDYYEE
jgi:hypothetical protein